MSDRKVQYIKMPYMRDDKGNRWFVGKHTDHWATPDHTEDTLRASLIACGHLTPDPLQKALDSALKAEIAWRGNKTWMDSVDTLMEDVRQAMRTLAMELTE